MTSAVPRIRRSKPKWYEDEKVELVPKSTITDEQKTRMRTDAELLSALVMERASRGMPIYQIASELDITQGTVSKSIRRWLQRESRRHAKLGLTYLQLQLARYNRSLAYWMPLAEMAYNPETGAINRRNIKIASRAQAHVSRIMTDINKLLRLGVFDKDAAFDAPTTPVHLHFGDVIYNVDQHGRPLNKDGKLLVDTPALPQGSSEADVIEGDFDDDTD